MIRCDEKDGSAFNCRETTAGNPERHNLPRRYSLPGRNAQLKSFEKRFEKDAVMKDRYRETNFIDLPDGHNIEVPPYDRTKRSRRKWYLSHHPGVNPKEPAKVRRILNGAATFQKASLNNSLLAGPGLLQNFIRTLHRSRELTFAVSADIGGIIIEVGVLEHDQTSNLCGGVRSATTL